MPRGLPQAILDKLATNNYSIVNLIQFHVDDSQGNPVSYFTDYSLDIDWGGNTYVATRGAMGVSDITEEEQFTIQQVTVVLSGVPSQNVKLFTDYDYIDRQLLIYRAIMDEDHSMIGSPVLVFDGRIDQPLVRENFEARTAELSVSASSHWVDFDQKNGRHTNNTEQQLLFANDQFFSFATETKKNIKWGRP